MGFKNILIGSKKKFTKIDEKSYAYYLMPKWINEVEITNNFFSEEENAWIEKLDYKTEEELKNIGKNNLKIAKNYIENINKEISIILPYWNHTCFSVASISYKIFRNFYNKFSIKFKTKIKEDTLLRESFIGGRCEVFGNPIHEEEEIKYFDFNNMYGNIMKDDFPVGKGKIGKEKNIDKPGFYWVTVEGKNEKIPSLPHRNEKSKGIFYTNGIFKGVYWHEELKEFISNSKNKIIDIEKSLTFKNYGKIFAEFAENCIEMRRIRENKKIWKKILVSLYGRLGMKKIDSTVIIVEENEYKKILKKDIEKEIWIKNFCIAQIKREEKLVKKVNSNVKYASIIASKARVKLLKEIKEFEEKKQRVLYVDTDCLFIAKKKEIKEEDTEKEKDWKKLEIMDAVFASIRNYSIKIDEKTWETKIAGQKRNSVSFGEFKKKFYGDWEMNYIKGDFNNIFFSNRIILGKKIKIKKYNKRVLSINKKFSNPLIKTGDFYSENIIL